ncbi:thiamine phosphate synthase [bacterium AH-315-M05]|nr:thiamine phosphate synthase [bacterium AH-315-M05]
MKLIVISSHKKNPSEPEIITQLFKNGLEIFHLRKPRFSQKELEEYLNLIPVEFFKRITIHSYHKLALKYNLRGIHLTRRHRRQKFKLWLKIKYIESQNPNIKITASFHSLESLFEDDRNYDYVFLSPVFDSISKGNYQAKFSGHNLEIILSKTQHNVIALGGVDIDKIDKIKEMNFAGMALHGAIWESKDPVEAFRNIYKACQYNQTSEVLKTMEILTKK